MSLHALKRLLDVLEQNNTFIVYACTEGNGDPLLEPRLPTIAKMIKDQIGAKIDVFTNGVLYNNRHLLNSPYLDDIRFSISASNPELYEHVHGKPLFHNALKTLKWVSNHKHFHQRLWVNFILYKDNAHDLENWKHMFKHYYQDIRPLHLGESRPQSSSLEENNKIVEHHQQLYLNRIIKHEIPCSCFHGLAVSSHDTFMQCIVLPYEYNWGNIEEIDILETYRKRLDIGLDHPGCKGCNQKNPHWRELFEKYVW
jgi:wyosine [tRNA(Phe)-imidazoG37] synthetase (radical SAM superfamily)